MRAECRLPNLFVGTLTRESVTQALEFGVQADQIVSFMQQHAHPHVLHKVPVVPEVRACLPYTHRHGCKILVKTAHHVVHTEVPCPMYTHLACFPPELHLRSLMAGA